jgi:hypothetical protein
LNPSAGNLALDLRSQTSIDTNCDTVSDVTDAIYILRLVASLDQPADGCIGDADGSSGPADVNDALLS